MPVITNFGDVTTVGNAAVNGTGTSSFAGPVTFAQGAAVTGSVSVTTSFYGVLSGQNTAAVSALTATTNVYAPIVTTPISNAATSIATTGFYGALAGLNTASVTVLTASSSVNAPTINVQTLNVSTQANVIFLNVSQTAFLSNANVLTANITSANVLTANVTTLNISGTAFLSNANVLTANLTSANVLTANVTSLNVSGTAFLSNANVLTGNITSLNVSTRANITFLNVSGTAFLSNANVLTANITSSNVLTDNVTFLNVSGTAFLSNANVLTGNITYANIVSLNVTGDSNISNLRVASNIYASNIIMSSNLSTNTGYGNVYLTGNLVVQGNIYSIGGSVGSGSGTSQGVLYSLATNYSLGSAFATGTAGPGVSGYHVNMTSFSAEAVASVSAFSAASGMLKFATGGLYQVTCVMVGDQPISKIAIGKTSSSSFPPSVTATTGYDYVYNYPIGSSPSTVITIPLTVTDTSQYYYVDVFFNTLAGSPTVLYPTRSATAAGANFGTYIQVGPFGNYLTSATGVASGLLMNCYGTTTLSSPVTSNTFRLAMTTANGWTVNGVSTSLAVTSGGNIQVNQVGIYEISMCLNPNGATPMMFGLGSLAADAAPSTQGPYLYQYAPMYTQDPTTVVNMPVNITDTSKYYYLDVIFPGSQSSIGLSNVSTFVSVKPVGSYVSPSTNPWAQQGTSVTYSSGAVGIGGVNPSALTETLTVSGNTSFVGNVTVTSDASGSGYVNARRVPAGSLDVTQYVTGRVPLTTTTNLIQNYLSNVSIGTQDSNVAVVLPGVNNSNVFIGPYHSVVTDLRSSNLFMETWIYVSAATASVGLDLVRQGSDWYWESVGTTSTTLRFIINGVAGATASSTTITKPGWNHLAVSYVATTRFKYYFLNGTLDGSQSMGTGPAVFTPAAPITIGNGWGGAIRDIRVMKGSIVPVTTFVGGAQAAPFTTAPTYVTGMNTGYTSNLALALQSQYFPGASTSPYGPTLTLPGTVGSYYTETGTFLNTPLNSGFTIEAWVNYASLANSNIFNVGPLPLMIGKNNPINSNGDWLFGVAQTGQIALNFFNGSGNSSINTAGIITTGSWNHIVAQANTTGYVNMFINGVQQTLQAGGYAGSGTAVALNGTVTTNQYAGITVGQINGLQGPNFAIAKARVLFGANTYTTSTFTPSPNLGPVPAGGTVAWSLESQFPLPTYPSFFDVPQLPQQLDKYGAEPVVVGGVTSNVLGPYTASPQFDSIRFDGTGYIDYGNAASSALTSNIWASPWTIEGWVYPTAFPGGQNFVLGRGNDFMLYINPAQVAFASNIGASTNYNAGSATFATGSWYHVAATFDGTRSNVYANGLLANTIPVSAMSMPFTPTTSFQVGIAYNTQYQGNLADVRVSNVARYTGSSYTVPSAPFATDSNTLLLLKSLGQQSGTTLEVQGRGLGSTSLGAGRVVQSYPPAPMSSYVLDTTGNTAVTYGQGKYVASASTDNPYAGGNYAWLAFDYNSSTSWQWNYAQGNYYPGTSYNSYIGPVATVDTLGTVYKGEWIQLQMPVSIILSTYTFVGPATGYDPGSWALLGSRDGTNWTAVHVVNNYVWSINAQTITLNVGATQAYNYFRWVMTAVYSTGSNYNVPMATISFAGTEEGLCVTSDSKVGVGIANPQRALEVAGDLVVSGTISGGAGMGSFRNKIINGDMRIAQRGTSNVVPYAPSYWYLIDRFAVQTAGPPTSGVITQYQTALGASETPYQLGLRNYANVVVSIGFNGTAANFAHLIEGYNIQDFNWGTSFASPVTLSFWFRTNAPVGSLFSYSFVNHTYGTSQFAGTFTIASPGTWQYYTFTAPPPPNGSSWGTGTNGSLIVIIAPYFTGGYTSTVNAWNSGSYTYFPYGAYPWPTITGTYVHFTGVQLEKGTVATPFEFRPYAAELALCQRYYKRIDNNNNTQIPYIGTGVFAAATLFRTGITHNIEMRAQPTVTANLSAAASTSNAWIQVGLGTGAGQYANATSISSFFGTGRASSIDFTTTGQTAGAAGVLWLQNAGLQFIDFSAEL